MATFSPISTSLAQEMNWTEDGKTIQKTDTIGMIRHDLSAAHALELSNVISELKAHPVGSTKKKNTSLVVE